MLKQLMMITGLMLLTSASWAQALNKASSFTAEQDATTGTWTLECNLSISEIDRLETYNVGIGLQYADGTSSVQIFNTSVVIPPDQRSASDFADGLYSFEAKKTGKKLAVSLEATWPAAYNGQRFLCSVSVSRGVVPDVVGIHAVRMENRIQGGAPPP